MGDVVHRISTRTRVDDDARRVRADVARYGSVVLLAGRSQARQLRRLQAALRATGHLTHYAANDELHMLTVWSTGPMPRSAVWWGGLG